MGKNKSVKRTITTIAALVLVGAIVFVIIYRNGTRRAIRDLPEPVQTATSGETAFTMDGYDFVIHYLYEYDIEALVVHTKDYLGFGIDDKLARHDLGLAWGTIAEYNEMIDFHWQQSGRFLTWHIDNNRDLNTLGGVAAIGEHCSNNHILPANNEIDKKVWQIRRGDHIHLRGYLVNVDGTKPDGSARYYWHSSTTRTDRGKGACEVFYVTDIEWL